MNERQTNRQMAESDPVFRQACAAAGLEPSRHHYRRYKHGRGRPAEIARDRLDNDKGKDIEISIR